MIGIIGAMDIEIEAIKNHMTTIKTENIAHINFYIGKLNGIDCVAAVCGPGKVNAAICTQIMISKFSPKTIINTGVAGALKENIEIGDIVLADSVVQHDMDTSAVGDEKGFISGINIINIPCSKIINNKIISICEKLNEHIYIGIIATGDQFISSSEKLSYIKNTFNASACEMEAGSIGHVCYVNNVDFVALRVISDNANSESHIDYNKFKFIVAEKTSHLICKLVDCI